MQQVRGKLPRVITRRRRAPQLFLQGLDRGPAERTDLPRDLRRVPEPVKQGHESPLDLAPTGRGSALGQAAAKGRRAARQGRAAAEQEVVARAMLANSVLAKNERQCARPHQ